jgi:exodeoxyribonuclease X
VSAYILDTELTDRKDGEIIEAAWLHFASETDLAGASDRIPLDLRVEEIFSARYKPSKPITFGAMAVHHILPHELEGCPQSCEFALPADCAYLIGHSIDTDWQAAGSPAQVKRIDTHAICTWLFPDATGYSQSALIYMLCGANESTRDMLHSAHSAAADVRLNHLLLTHILRLKPEITTWSELWAYSEECRIPRTCPMKKYEGVLLADLDDGFINWCLNQSWLDPYYRKGLERVLDARYPDADGEDDDDDWGHRGHDDEEEDEETRGEIPF